MNRQEAVEITERSLKELNEALKNGKSDVMQAYLKSLAVFPRYSYRNIFLIQAQMPLATRIAGFTQWKKLGRWVKSGEKGIGIIAPLATRARSTNESDDDKIFGFRLVHVFDISQTDGETLPGISQPWGNPLGNLDVLEKVYSKLGIYLESTMLPDGFFGRSLGGQVTISAKLEPASRFQTLAHELAHELMHSSKAKLAERPSKSIRELEAEAIAYVVCVVNGVECRDASCDYIQMYDGNETLLAASLERIRGTAVEILDFMDSERNSSISSEVNHAA